STNTAIFAIGGTPATSLAASASTTFTVTFDPAVAGTANAIISFTNNDADEDPYSFAVKGAGSVAAAPSVAITGLPTSFTQLTPIPVTMTFDQAVTGFAASDLILSGATLSGFAGGPSVWTATLTPTGTGDITLSIPANSATNTTGQGNTSATAQSTFNTVVQTSETIVGFMSQRSSALLANQPDITLLGQPGERRFDAQLTQNRLSFLATSHSNPGLWYELNGSVSVLGTGKQEYLFGAVGTQSVVSPTTTLGAMLQFDHSKHRDGVATIEGQGMLVGPYFVTTLQNQPLTFDGRLLWGKTRNKISPFGTYTDRFDTTRLLATLEATGQLVFDDTVVSPKIGFNYVSDRQEAYIDSLNTTIPAQDISMTNLSFGADWASKIPVAKGELLFTGGLAGIWTSGSSNASDLLKGGRGRLDLGLVYRLPENTDIKVDLYLDGIGNGNYQNYGLSVAIEHRF
ncbi:MAG: Ig-like domain-containing protein, partial [Planktomarina sp.]